MGNIPSNVAAEEAVLGAVLLNNKVFPLIETIVGAADFWHPSHRLIFQAMQWLNDKGEPIDSITISSCMGARLVEIGGLVKLAALGEAGCTATHTEAYAKLVRGAAVKRAFIEAGRQIVEAASGDDDAVVVSELAGRVVSQAMRAEASGEAVSISVVVSEAARAAFLREERGQPIDLTSGFAELDAITAGLHAPDLTILGGRPGMGKTALALDIAKAAALDKRTEGDVLFFSAEMSREQLGMRWLSRESGVPLEDLRLGRLDYAAFPKIAKASGSAEGVPFLIDDASAPSVLYVRNRARMVALERKIKLIVVDYLQLLTFPGLGGDRYAEVTAISGSLKALAKELAVPVIALAQLSRKLEDRPDKRPVPSDLRESGSIEQDADNILFVYRDAVYNAKARDEDAEVIIAKQRNGRLGTARLTWDAIYTTFRSRADPGAQQSMPLPLNAVDHALRVLTAQGPMDADALAGEVERRGWKGSGGAFLAELEAAGFRFLGDGRVAPPMP